MSRIINDKDLYSHGNIKGRKVIVQIMEAGLSAANPYNNTRKLVRIEDGKLMISAILFVLFAYLVRA